MVQTHRLRGAQSPSPSLDQAHTHDCDKPADLDRIRPIHIAGTKGKGSTSAFISSILARYRRPSDGADRAGRVRKIGLYTSPHLRSVRERIQINNEPLSEDAFAKYFFEVWRHLEESARRKGLATDVPTKPVYFRFLTLLAFHAFLREDVDTAVIETGIGGEYDSTNVLIHPTVTGITSLGIDHVLLLGNAIEDIAWHKAGIMKSGARAFTVPQPAGALKVLQKRAKEKAVTLDVVESHPELERVRLGLAGDFQKTNASLAVSVAAAHLRSLGFEDIPEHPTSSPLPESFRQGLEEARWGGRCEKRRTGKVVWFIDGGHTLESIELAAKWYSSETASLGGRSGARSRAPKRVLVFNQQTRDAVALARALHETLARTSSTAGDASRPFTHVLFCTNVTFKDGGYKADLASLNANSKDVEYLSVQTSLAGAWCDLERKQHQHQHQHHQQQAQQQGHRKAETVVQVLKTIEHAVEYVDELAADSEVDGDTAQGASTHSRVLAGTLPAEKEKEEEEEEEGEEKVAVFVTGSLHLVGGLLEVLEQRKMAGKSG